MCCVCVDCGRGECPLQILDIILASARKHQQPEKKEQNGENKHFNSYYILPPKTIIARPKWLTGGNG